MSEVTVQGIIGVALSVIVASLLGYVIHRLKEIERQLNGNIAGQNCSDCNLREITDRIEAMLEKLESMILTHNHSEKGVVIRKS